MQQRWSHDLLRRKIEPCSRTQLKRIVHPCTTAATSAPNLQNLRALIMSASATSQVHCQSATFLPAIHDFPDTWSPNTPAPLHTRLYIWTA